MSYWISLLDKDTNDVVCVDQHAEGGTYAVGGTTEAALNVTYNYGPECRRVGVPLPGLQDVCAGDTIQLLEKAVGELGTARSRDYWAATSGNAGYALSILLAWAKRHPDAVWRVH